MAGLLDSDWVNCPADGAHLREARSPRPGRATRPRRGVPLLRPPRLTRASVTHTLGGHPLLHVGVAAPGVHVGLIHGVPRLPVAGRGRIGVIGIRIEAEADEGLAEVLAVTALEPLV